VRLVGSLAITETFKQKKHVLADEGFDPARTRDALYCDLGAGYVPLTADIYNDIRSGRTRF
jgi:fatty-acyl-CoA synthase